MMPEKDQTIAKLLEDSKEMIHRFESLTGTRVEEVADNTKQNALEEYEESMEPAADAFFDLFVEDDAMTATAEYRPPAGEGKPLELNVIEEALFRLNINHGILWEAIHNALHECNLELKLQTGVIVARGTPPVPFIPEHVQLVERWMDHAAKAGPEKIAIDFKEISPFVMVQKGDLLALRVPDAHGSHGIDVLGREIPFPTQKTTDWVPGPNVVDTPVGYEAGVDGRLILELPNFSVNPILELPEGIDYHTGNIQFHGEVIIHKKVASGFSIEAGGSLTCQDTLDAFLVKVGGDLTTPGGIIGNGAGRIETGGIVSAKFLEHVYLTGQNNVLAETCVLNCIVKTRGKLILGEKGILAGGQIHALHGVDLFQIGTATGPRTEIFVGLDFQGMERILWIRERSKELHSQLKKVDAAIPYGGNRVKDLMAAAKKLRTEIVQLTENARVQLMKLGQDEEASVMVRGAAYPGTLIEICHVQFLVTQKMMAVRFSLDKRKGIIAVESLKAATPSGTSKKKH